MKRVFVILLAVVVIGALILSGCTKPTPSTTTTTTQTQTSTSTKTTTTTSEAPHKVLKIGSVISMVTPTGVEEKKWFNLFAKLINEQGGWKIGADTYDVDMIVYDTGNDATMGKNYLEKLVLQDGVKFILGSPTSNPATDAEVTEPNKVICLGVDVTGTSADPKIQYYWTPMGFSFSSGFMYIVYKDMEAKGAKTYVSLKTDDMMGHFTDGWGKATWAVAAPSVKYLDTVFYDPTVSDYGPVATKVMTLNPDVVDCAFNVPNSGIYNALYDAGFKGKVFPSIDPGTFASVINHSGKGFVEGWKYTFTDPRLYPNQDPAMLALVDAYTKEYGTFHDDGCTWLQSWFVLKDAIDSTQSVDVEVIKAYLDNQPHAVRTMTGYCQLFARPDVGNLRTVSGISEVYIGITKDGVLVPFKATTVKDHYLATILCNGLVDVYKAYWAQYGYPKLPAGETSTVKFSDLGITGQD